MANFKLLWSKLIYKKKFENFQLTIFIHGDSSMFGESDVALSYCGRDMLCKETVLVGEL